MNILVIILSALGLVILIIGGIELYKNHVINSIVDDIKRSPLNRGDKK